MNASTDEAIPELFIVPHTHWDREWYLTFQDFRRRLVRLVDLLLRILEEDPGFCAFMLDGQTVVLEDYLEVRPEMESALRRAISGGRIQAGPWYVLPDENLVSGESVIRNLERGISVAERFGEAMMLGYLPDQFGHIASMPEILSGFGMDTACVWRGVGDKIDGPAFWWEGPSGASVMCLYLPHGYGNAARLPLTEEELLSSIEEIVARLRPWHERCPLKGLPYLLMNGSDHEEPQAGLPGSLAKALKGKWRWHIGTLQEYAQIARNLSRTAQQLPVHRGELRSSMRAPLLAGVLSTRHWIKQRDWKVCRDLERYAEPLSALAQMLTGEPGNYDRYLDLAWRYVLQNHPHDSICGCSIDPVHEDMKYRFDQAEAIVRKQVEETGSIVAGSVDASYASGRPSVVVYNPGPATDQALVEARIPGLDPDIRFALDAQGVSYPIQVLRDDQSFVTEQTYSPAQVRFYMRFLRGRRLADFYINAATLGDRPDGLFVELVTSDRPEGYFDVETFKRDLSERLARLPVGSKVHVTIRSSGSVRILFHPGRLPSLGLKAFAFVSGSNPGATRGTLRVTHRSMENEFFRVDVARDGYLVITDLASGAIYPVANLFVDGGDRGDEYNWDPPSRDALIKRPRLGPLQKLLGTRVTVEERGPVRGTLRVDLVYSVPRGLTSDRDGRDRRTVELGITTRVSLAAGIRRIDFRTTVENRADDHRLRVYFRAPFAAEKSWAGCQFYVVERDARPAKTHPADPAGGQGAAETPPSTHPMRDFVDISDGRLGLAVSTRGLYEYEVIPETDHTDLAITLMRCVGFLSRPDLRTRPGDAGPCLPTPGAQCHGRWDFEYSLIPHAGGWHESSVPALAWAYQNPPLAFPSGTARPGALTPPEVSFFAVDAPDLLWSCLRKTPSGEFELRFYNVSGADGRANLRSYFRMKDLRITDLAGRDICRGAGLPTLERVEPSSAVLRYGPHQLITLRFRVDPAQGVP